MVGTSNQSVPEMAIELIMVLGKTRRWTLRKPLSYSGIMGGSEARTNTCPRVRMFRVLSKKGGKPQWNLQGLLDLKTANLTS